MVCRARTKGISDGLFQLDGQDFMALNGGPHFKFTEAISALAGWQEE